MSRYGNLHSPKAKRSSLKSNKKIHQNTSRAMHYGPKGMEFAQHNMVPFINEGGLGYKEKTGDAVSRYSRQQLVELSRQLDDENLVYATMLDRMCANLLGPNGFTLQARTGSTVINDFIEKELWPEFTASPEFRDLFSWKDCQYSTMRDLLNVGDIGFVKLTSGQLQAVENEMINTPTNNQLQTLAGNRKVEQGIEMTDAGKVKAYWVTKADKNGYVTADGRRISKENFIYCHGKVQRFSRTRPIPPMIQIASSIWRLDDILNSEAVCWQLLSKHAIAITQGNADETAFELSDDDDEAGDAPKLADRITESEAGLFFWGEPGETISGVDRNLPGKDFPASVRAFMQMFAMRYGLPLEIMMLDWSKTNFSSGKAALTQATQNIREWQVRLVEQFHMQVYEWKIRQWVAEGVLPQMDIIGNHEWFPPLLPWVDPKEMAESWGIQIDRGLVTYSSALKHQGKDRETENQQREDDIIAAIAMSKKIKLGTGVDVDWKYFAGYAVGKTESAFKQGEKTEDPKEEENPEPKEEEEDE